MIETSTVYHRADWFARRYPRSVSQRWFFHTPNPTMNASEPARTAQSSGVSGLSTGGRPGRGRPEPRPRARGDEVHEEAIGPRHPGRQLPEEGVARVDEGALAVPREQEPARLVAFARIVRFNHRFISGVPGPREIEAALLDPPVEVGGRELVRKRQERARGIHEPDRGLLDGHPVARELEGIRPEVLRDEVARRVVLRDERAAAFDVVNEARLGELQAGARVVRADSRHDGGVTREVAVLELVV